jgi:hypothetical protein
MSCTASIASYGTVLQALTEFLAFHGQCRYEVLFKVAVTYI